MQTLSLEGSELSVSDGHCQNHPNRPAVWPATEPHLCLECRTGLEARREVLEAANYQAQLEKRSNWREKHNASLQ